MTALARDITGHWCDDVAVDRALNGRNVGRPLTPAERREVFRQMHRRGDSYQQIADTLGINGPTYRKWRKELAP